MKYDFPTAFSEEGDEERAAMRRVIASGRYTMGPEVEAFEHEFAEWHGMRHGVMVNSGSSANLVAVAALAAKESQPIIAQGHNNHLGHVAAVPAIAWSTTYAPLVQHGVLLRLVDVDDTWNAPVPDWPPMHSLKVIVACSILGNPGYLTEWKAVADRAGAYLIEDNCESLGAVQILGGRCGTHGIMNTFSFFYSHQIAAIEGGMILTDDDECARLCRILRAHGWTRDVAAPASFDDEYDFTHFGYNVRPVEMHAAVAREQLKKLPRFIDERRKNAALFRDLTADLPITCPPWNGDPSPFGLQFLCPSTDDRVRLVGALRAEGIDCRLPTGGSFLRHAYGGRWAEHQATPRADAVHDCGLFLGCAPYDISDKIEKAVRIMRSTL